jgi:hypothetical protein
MRLVKVKLVDANMMAKGPVTPIEISGSTGEAREVNLPTKKVTVEWFRDSIRVTVPNQVPISKSSKEPLFII